MFELHCGACAQPGASSDSRDEVQALADLHNSLIHRGSPVAVLRRNRRFGRSRATAAAAA